MLGMAARSSYFSVDLLCDFVVFSETRSHCVAYTLRVLGAASPWQPACVSEESEHGKLDTSPVEHCGCI